MRIWKGSEREDKEHKMTLFVEASLVSDRVVEVVSKVLRQNPDVERVYFGAGGVTGPESLCYVCADLSCIKVEKVAEIHSERIKFFDVDVFDKVIMTTPVKSLEKIVPKIQTDSVLRVFKEELEVDFSEVSKGCYNNDVEIYKD